MKIKLYFSLILSFLFSLGISAQTYQPLVIEGAHWQVYYDADLPGEQSYGFSIEGDSTYNNVEYKKVYKLDLLQEYTRLYNADSTDWVTVLDYLIFESKYLYALLREDVIEQKVYSIIFEDPNNGCESNEEQLLYDFSLSVGDTSLACASIPEYPFIVESISGENIWGQERKIFHHNILGTEETLVEGIGYNGILFFYASTLPATANWYITLWDYCIGTDEECLNFPTAVNDINHKKVVKIYPNPTYSNQLQIESTDFLPNAEVHIFNALGQEISKVKLLQKVQTLYLPYPGIYYYKVVSENRVVDGGVIERI